MLDLSCLRGSRLLPFHLFSLQISWFVHILRKIQTRIETHSQLPVGHVQLPLVHVPPIWVHHILDTLTTEVNIHEFNCWRIKWKIPQRCDSTVWTVLFHEETPFFSVGGLVDGCFPDLGISEDETLLSPNAQGLKEPTRVPTRTIFTAADSSRVTTIWTVIISTDYF